MTTITCKIPERLDAELEAAAHQRRVSKSRIVREALEQRLRRSRRVAAVTAYDLAKSVCGTLRGPSDLATNPEYMEGFGA
jgi:predicted transcriptional regulator